MSATLLRTLGLVISLAYSAAVVRVYVRRPATFPEVTGSLRSSIGAYHADRGRFDAGLRFFRQGQFVEARDAFAQADPARQDPNVQFYVAYAYLRQGWGRAYSDDTLYKAGFEALEQGRRVSPTHTIEVSDPDLKLHTSEELAAEFQRGLTRELSDLNPARLWRERP
jgi:hypothetical protein